MEQHIFQLKTTCAYCLRKAGEDVDCVLPVHDWETDKLLGYFCKKHYMRVKAKNINSSHFEIFEDPNYSLYA
ncbi:hypothetical protein [Lederbergia lenta]|uniref:Uncharacterized protein n=1 Tax=Lederbergia lenta TaxID=1467 RepID=A0A2X4VR79_LEDLE|nr:hypothetical protein [Lederbergia lenta]MCM3110600.1 hypothetical protein [Lederbergia lenta]MEC2325941.1 hypothetical protein [Lederbergia lenta]SQI53483.1 Uncharacterised protein [Lederbergia lenta]